MQIPDDTQVLDLNCAMPVPAILAHIATVLELHGAVYVRNATAPASGPGTCALHLGFRLSQAQQLKPDAPSAHAATTEEELNVPGH